MKFFSLSRLVFFLLHSRKLGLDLVPRQGAHMVDPDTMSVVELYHVVSIMSTYRERRIEHHDEKRAKSRARGMDDSDEAWSFSWIH